jgi:hypothetical protein
VAGELGKVPIDGQTGRQMLDTEIPNVRLDEFDKDEWWDVARMARPELTREQYDEMWDDFLEMKKKRRLQ